MSKLSPATLHRLERSARGAVKTAYAPYSKFAVGSAVLAGSGKIYAGVNVENASFGLCNCAERTAIFSAVTAGEKEIAAVVVYTPTATPTAPCGACRQVINEFGPAARIVGICDSVQRLDTTLPALFGAAFGPKNLRAKRVR